MTDQDQAPLAVDEHTVAKALSMSIHWVRKDRTGRRLLPFFRVGGRVLYDLGRVRQALASMEEGGPESNRKRQRANGR